MPIKTLAFIVVFQLDIGGGGEANEALLLRPLSMVKG